MKQHDANRLVKGALLLTVAGLLSKLLSAGYRIPLQNLTGNVGFYVYQQVYPILGMGLILSMYGFPSAVARLSVDFKQQKNGISITHFMLPIFMLLLVINGVLFLLLYVNASKIAALVGDIQLTKTYQMTAFVFLLIPFTALLRGVFQGNVTMQPIAFSQVGEQIVRVLIIIMSAYLYAQGKLSHIYVIGNGAVLATIAGMIAAIVILLIFLYRRQILNVISLSISWKYYFRTLVVLGIVASLNHMILLIIQLADTMTLVPQLVANGLSKEEAIRSKGIFDRGQPLIQLGVVLGSSFALTFIPTVGKHTGISKRSLADALSLSFYLAAGATIGLIMIFPETNKLLFTDVEGTRSLQILACAILLSALSVTVISILQGLGLIKRTALFILITFMAKYICNIVFVPIWGITGSALATLISLFILCLFTFHALHKQHLQSIFLIHIHWFAFIKASLGMICFIVIAKLIDPLAMITSRFVLLIYVLCVVIGGAVIYTLILIRHRAFTKEQLAALPFSSFFFKFYK